MQEARSAILALLALSLIVIQVQGHTAQTRMQMMRSEVQLVASGVGTQYLDEVGTMSFDDIMDLGGEQTTVLVPLQSDTMAFDLLASVRFVEKQGSTFAATQDTTDYQEVSVAIEGLLGTTVTMSQIYSLILN